MFISMVLEKRTHYLISERKRLFWSIDRAGPQARLLILKNASQINGFTYLIYGISARLEHCDVTSFWQSQRMVAH
jgi:hypothetical protein